MSSVEFRAVKQRGIIRSETFTAERETDLVAIRFEKTPDPKG